MKKYHSKSGLGCRGELIKLDSILKNIQKFQQQSYTQLPSFNHYQPNASVNVSSSTTLLSKAQQITSKNKKAISRARSNTYKCDSGKGTFLTGLTLANPQKQIEQQQQGKPLDETQLAGILKMRDTTDDLAELKRMIKQTDRNLKDYRNKVFKTQKAVGSLNRKLNSCSTVSLPKLGMLHHLGLLSKYGLQAQN